MVRTAAIRGPLLEDTLNQWAGRAPLGLAARLARGVPFAEVVSPWVPMPQLGRFLDYYTARMAEVPTALCPGVRPFLERLHETATPAAIVSASLRRLVEADLIAMGISDRVATIFASDGQRFV
ncbi:MAG: hypothetical protein LBJ08_09395, partial [Bifidobacteriaceae bacterium]|nr:hypothetical protein [Bifidobacteriaceae bacterium]